ncbi:MAG TPA: molecular chaperone TorD family protein [Dongiaceae bacterium]|nr:molecular chaperone TorD family protein [Dongiaceae bacterium]
MDNEAAVTVGVDLNDGKAAPGIDWEQMDLYRFFAFAVASPTRERFEFLSQAALPAALQNLWSRLECAGDYPGFDWFSCYGDYEAAYIALFDVGMPEPPVPLFESAHNKSHPAQEVALENTFFYEVLGLRSDPNRAVPDYLITQLEFLAAVRYTYQNTSDEATAISLARAETEFLERHLLNWVPKAAEKLQKAEAAGFALLLRLLAQFLLQRHAGSWC